MNLRPFFSFYGSKWVIARRYPAPAHPVLVEPFAGSASYAVRYPHLQVHLYDKDPVLVGVWDYLIHAKGEELLALPDIAPGTSVDDYGLPQEARWLIGFWLNKGNAYPCRVPSRWMCQLAYARQFWGASIRSRLAAQVQYIRHWTVELAAYQEIENRTATWFVDPPYSARGHHYRHGNSGVDYDALGRWCRTRVGQAIVCEQEGPTWLPFRPLVDAKATTRGGRDRRSREVFWTHG